jgi:asparagine synthase (glutamine-hydrolysing)
VGYHSRTVVHRDERLAMVCGVETRFPFLDHDLLRLAANIPFRHKIRTSLRAVNMPHPFIREKWVLRKVAERYLPKGFAFRGKVGFPATVFKRMTVHPDFFRESYICDLFGLSEAEKAHLLATTERRTIVRMMFLEVWAQLFFCGRPESELVQRVRPHIRVAPA